MSNKSNSVILDQLLYKQNLDDETSTTLMKRWLNDEILDVQTGAFLSAFRAKGATAVSYTHLTLPTNREV